MMSDDDFEIVGGEPPQEPVDVPREGIEKLAAFADDVFSPGDTIPVSEITLLLPFIKFGPDESGGRTSTISVLLDLESRLLSRQQTYGKEAGSTWHEFVKEEGLTLPEECNGETADGRRKRVAYALSKFLPGVVYLPDAGRALSRVPLLSAGRIASIFPRAGTGLEAEASVADVALIAGALNVALPVDQSDASAWRTSLLAMSAKIQPVAVIGLATLRSTPDTWRATASTLQRDGSLLKPSRGLGVSEALSIDSVTSAFFDGVDTPSQHRAIEAIFRCIPEGRGIKRDTAETSDVRVKRQRVLHQIYVWAGKAGWEAERLRVEQPTPAASDGSDDAAVADFDPTLYALKWSELQTASESRNEGVATDNSGTMSRALESAIAALARRPADASPAPPAKRPLIVNADDDDEAGDTSADRLSSSMLSKLKPDLDALRELDGQAESVVLDRLYRSDDSLRRLMSEPVSAVKAASSEGAKTVREVKAVAVRAAQDAARKHSQAHPESDAVEVPRTVFHDLLKGEFLKSGPHKFAFPVLFSTLEEFIASLWTKDAADFWKTWRRWALCLDTMLDLGASEFVKRAKAIADTRCDDGTVFGWTSQHIADMLVHFVHVGERKFKAWLREPASSAASVPRFREFESWVNSKETLDTYLRQWNTPGQARPVHLPKLRTASGTVKSSSGSAAAAGGTAWASADSSLVQVTAAQLRKLLSEASAASVDGSGKAAKLTRAERRKAAAANEAPPAANAPAPAPSPPKPRETHASKSVVGACRSSKKFIDLIRDPKTKAVVDKHGSILRKGADLATCAGWMCLTPGCAGTVDADGRCQFGAHFVTDDSEGEAAAFIRELGKAEGRDMSAFRGFEDSDFKP